MQSNVQFINIEYVFNRIFDAYLWVKYFALFKIGGEDVNEYLASKEGVAYDGLRDRFGIGSGEPFSGSLANTITSNIPHTGGTGFFDRLLSIFSNGGTASVGGAVSGASNNTAVLMTFLSWFRDIMTIVALILITFYIYSSVRWKEVVAEHEAIYDKSYKAPKVPEYKNTKWSVVEAHMASGKETEWRLAILEADNMLADLLRTLPILGKDVGEKLTNANRSNFATLEDAWEAHKVRNRIAHDGSSFILTEHLARKTISQFRNVFEEFKFGID
jgi:hypothetical protein